MVSPNPEIFDDPMADLKFALLIFPDSQPLKDALAYFEDLQRKDKQKLELKQKETEQRKHDEEKQKADFERRRKLKEIGRNLVIGILVLFFFFLFFR